MKQTYYKGVAARRRLPLTIIIARGEEIRYFTVRPSIAVSALAVSVLLLLSGSSLIVLRDQIFSPSESRQVRIQQAYEDRIATLRTQLERVTSQQLLEQQLISQRMDALAQRQERLAKQQGRLSPFLQRAEELRTDNGANPIPTPRPELRASFSSERMLASTSHAYAAPADHGSAHWPLRESHDGLRAGDADTVLSAINRAMHDLEADQQAHIRTLIETTYRRTEGISAALQAAGLPVASEYEQESVGGPLLPETKQLPFEERIRELDEALDRLETLKKKLRRLPVANPLPGAARTSNFGTRKDPILGRLAHHSGIDFRAPFGAPVQATGKGVVVKAGWNGGYGRMVEIDHGNGLITRYAHLSKILVDVGATIDKGEIVGRVGSSGRSTGPHLHYEVRHGGTAVDPSRFIAAGQSIQQYL